MPVRLSISSYCHHFTEVNDKDRNNWETVRHWPLAAYQGSLLTVAVGIPTASLRLSTIASTSATTHLLAEAARIMECTIVHPVPLSVISPKSGLS